MSLTGQRRIGAFKPPKSTGMTLEAAEALAATAFAALAGDPPRLARFMAETGIGPDDLRAAAGSTELSSAILEHVLADQSLLLVVASEIGQTPEAIGHALAVLQKPPLGSP
jgi:hypothetical protein